MGDYLSNTVINALNAVSPKAKEAGFLLGDELDAIKGDIASGNVGITADARDVNAAAPGSALFAEDDDSHNGLDFAFFGGQVLDGQTIHTVPAGDVTLAPSTTNYVEVLYSGGTWAVSANQTGFTAGAVPLYVVSTGASSIATVTNKRVVLRALRDNGVTGKLLSTAGRTKLITVPLGTVNATTTFRVPLPNFAATLVRAALVQGAAIAASDPAYWTFALTNKGTGGAGATAMLAASDANTTKATGGSALSADVARDLTLHGTPANLDAAAKDVLHFVLTKTGAAADLTGATLLLEVTHQG